MFDGELNPRDSFFEIIFRTQTVLTGLTAQKTGFTSQARSAASPEAAPASTEIMAPCQFHPKESSSRRKFSSQLTSLAAGWPRTTLAATCSRQTPLLPLL